MSAVITAAATNNLTLFVDTFSRAKLIEPIVHNAKRSQYAVMRGSGGQGMKKGRTGTQPSPKRIAIDLLRSTR